MRSDMDKRRSTGSRPSKIKKILKYIFIALGTVTVLTLIVSVLIYFLFVEELADADTKESTSRETLSNEAMLQIASYHEQNGYYPKNLQSLPIYNNTKFVYYVKKGEFRYATSGSNYSFSWRGGAMNWTGYRCTNAKTKAVQEKEYNVIRVFYRADGAVCTVTDLH